MKPNKKHITGALRNFKKQSGVALITALILTTIAVSVAGTVMYRQQIQIRLSSNIAHMEQAYLYANGMEDWAGTILIKSFNDHKEYDSVLDDWAVLLPPIPIPGGVMNGQLFDLQARLNLNSLDRPQPIPPPPPREGQPQPEPKPDIADINRQRIQKLIEQVDPDQEMGPPENFTDIVKDWIDKDQENGNHSNNPEEEISGNGAESPYYQSLEPAYYSANTLLVSPTELRLLKGVDKKIYNKLKEHVSTLPIKANNNEIKTPININTATVDVLKTIGFDPTEAGDIYDKVQDSPFESKEEFENYVSDNIPEAPADFKHDTDVNSSYFLLQGKVEIHNSRLFINSILERKNGRISVIMRDFSKL